MSVRPKLKFGSYQPKMRGEVSNRRRQKKRDPFDFYIEEQWCVESLFDAVKFTGEILDPCAGSGTVPRVARARGYIAASGDILQRITCPRLDFVIDFLEFTGPVDNVVMNPPYRLAQKFVTHALTMAVGKVAALVPIKFLCGQKRRPWFQKYRPDNILFLSKRASMPPGDLLLAGKIKAKGGIVDYCWIVWTGTQSFLPTHVDWITRND